MIEYALHYAKQGWRVFPLLVGGKLPLISKEQGGKGYKDATSHIPTIEMWWGYQPEANVGLATGNVLVVDLDIKHQEWFASVQSLKLPATLTIKTASGGWHLYYEMPDDCDDITIGAGLLPGIDWRGHKGYVVAAGSQVNGKYYTIAKPLPMVEAPASLIERIRAKKKKREPLERTAAGVGTIPTGSRNQTLFSIACYLRGRGIDFNAILESVRAINNDHCDPPLPDDELRVLSGSACRYEPNAEQG